MPGVASPALLPAATSASLTGHRRDTTRLQHRALTIRALVTLVSRSTALLRRLRGIPRRPFLRRMVLRRIVTKRCVVSTKKRLPSSTTEGDQV